MSQSSDSRLGSLAHWFTFRESWITAQFFGLQAYFLGLLDLSLGSLARKSSLPGLRDSDSITASLDLFAAHLIRVETHVFRLTLNYVFTKWITESQFGSPTTLPNQKAVARELMRPLN
jgi:hypothetical protein